jgi:hypothetical protein
MMLYTDVSKLDRTTDNIMEKHNHDGVVHLATVNDIEIRVDENQDEIYHSMRQ